MSHFDILFKINNTEAAGCMTQDKNLLTRVSSKCFHLELPKVFFTWTKQKKYKCL